MNKLIELLKAKALQITITSISVCIVAGASAGAVIHSNNEKLEAVLNELSSSSTTESVTESSSETTTESTTAVSTTEKIKNITTTTATEPAGDRTIQYLAEYERITKEYEKKRAELEEYTVYVTVKRIDDNASDEEKASLNEVNSSADAHNEKVNDSLKKIEELDKQYEKDIENLKKEYKIVE